MHELELFIPETSTALSHVRFPRNYSFEEESADHSSYIDTYAFRYEMSKLFHDDRRLYYGLGLGINPYYTKVTNETLVSSRYYVDLKTYGIALNVIPRAVFKVTDRFRVDVNIPLNVYDLRRERRFVNNPNIPFEQQKFKETAHKLFENAYTVRLGIAYVLR